ncbi:MAG: fatty acid desaturase [Acidobacteriota bacterium]|nr:fatty acid desaturase [Acidobacteriota bacterium]MDH3783801.1 fatty acid desaturase [Acidobacteriota bacterium]
MKDATGGKPRSWGEILGPYARPSVGRSLFQLINTVVLFGIMWFLMYRSLEISYWLTLLLAIPTTGLQARLFIIQHDCGHGSFFRSKTANTILGSILGVVTLTPYTYWRRTHALHHASSGDLDHRGFGDVTTLTVNEYLALDRWGQFKYRMYRTPLVLFIFGPFYEFILRHRFPAATPWSWKKEWASVFLTNLAIAAVMTIAALTIGLKPFLVVELPIIVFAGSLGIWLFYIQHQFEDTYWENNDGWNFHKAGLKGASHYDLPRLLHWLTGNIGIHHVHHLSSRIPNYRLQQCVRENPELQQVTRLTMRESLKCARLKLWDEQRGKLIGFSQLP